MARRIASMPRLPPALQLVVLAECIANLRSPRPECDVEQCHLYAAHSRALLALSRNPHPAIGSLLLDELPLPPWR